MNPSNTQPTRRAPRDFPISWVLWGLVLLSLGGFSGCSGSSEAKAPELDELQQFVQDNPDIADGSGTMGDE